RSILLLEQALVRLDEQNLISKTNSNRVGIIGTLPLRLRPARKWFGIEPSSPVIYGLIDFLRFRRGTTHATVHFPSPRAQAVLAGRRQPGRGRLRRPARPRGRPSQERESARHSRRFRRT